MTEQQKTQDGVGAGQSEVAKAKIEKAKAALANAVAKRNDARKMGHQGASRASHGGKPISNLKVSDQTRGKQG